MKPHFSLPLNDSQTCGEVMDSRLGRPLAGRPRGRQRLLFGPLHYEPNYAYPLVVWLHGRGQSEQHLVRMMPKLSLRNYVAVAVRGGCRITRPDGATGYDWGTSTADFAQAEESVLEAIELAAARYHVAPGRVFVAGYDSGAAMALRVGLLNPQHFAGVAALGGGFAHQHGLLRRLHEVRRLAVFLACGRDSREFAPETADGDAGLLEMAGVPVELREYASGQELTADMLADLNHWIMSQFTSIVR